MPVSLLPLTIGINPDENIYTEKQFRYFKNFFSDSGLFNPLCERINCFNVNLDHTHSTPETKEEYQERIIRLLEEWKEDNEDHRVIPVDPIKRGFYEREMAKLSQLISFWKDEHSFEEKVTKLSEYFEDNGNNRISAFSKSSQLFELEERCKKLLKEEKDTKKVENNSKNLIEKFFSSPWTWFGLLSIVLISVIIAYKKRKSN